MIPSSIPSNSDSSNGLGNSRLYISVLDVLRLSSAISSVFLAPFFENNCNGCNILGGDDFWQRFYSWLLGRGLRERYADDLVNYARKFSWLLSDGANLGVLEGVPAKRMILSALSNLARFLGCYREWRMRLEDAGVRWTGMSSEDCFVNLYGGEQSVSSFLSWMERIKPRVDWDLWVALVFMAITGLRTGEAIYALNKISDVGLVNYPYNAELHVLEHFRDRWFLRKSKKAYISVLTPRLEKILGSEWNRKISYEMLRLRLRRRNLECRLYDARKFQNTVLWKAGLDEQTINLLVGRLGVGIFQRHYWRPNIGELFSKVKEALKPYEEMWLSQ